MVKLQRKLHKQHKNMENSIIDLIIRIKNGYMAKRDIIVSPYSNYKGEVLKKLLALKYIKGYKVEEKNNKKHVVIELLYKDEVPVLTDIKLFSKPGQRIYVSYSELKNVMGGFGVSILSTSKGILTNRQARKQMVGGELLFNIW